MEIYKAKLPAGLSYVLKPSLFEGILTERNVLIATSLFQGGGREMWGRRSLFAATFYPPGHYHLNETEVLHVNSYAVPSDQRRDAYLQLEQTVLPEFFSWIEAILAEPDRSTVRRETQRFKRYLEVTQQASD